MLLTPAKLADLWLIRLQPVHDSRGFFSRTFCTREFADHNLETEFPQHSVSLTKQRGTVRGMHFQTEPYAETKVVTCIKGRAWDVVIDLRENSPTYKQWQGFELSADNRDRVYIPKGFAHGFQTLEDDTEMSYLISAFYEPTAASGVRYDDPVFAIEWPLPVSDISDKDRAWPLVSAR